MIAAVVSRDALVRPVPRYDYSDEVTVHRVC